MLSLKECIKCGKLIPDVNKTIVLCSDCAEKEYAKTKYRALRLEVDSALRRKRFCLFPGGRKLKLIEVLFAVYDFACPLCGDNAEHSRRLHENHHIKPVKECGSAEEANAFENQIILCPNHHKMADLGWLDRDTLRRNVIVPPSDLLSRRYQFTLNDDAVTVIRYLEVLSFGSETEIDAFISGKDGAK